MTNSLQQPGHKTKRNPIQLRDSGFLKCKHNPIDKDAAITCSLLDVNLWPVKTRKTTREIDKIHTAFHHIGSLEDKEFETQRERVKRGKVWKCEEVYYKVELKVQTVQNREISQRQSWL